jgi:predicted transcriptional regulator
MKVKERAVEKPPEGLIPTRPITIRLDDATLAAIDLLAETESRTRSNWIVRTLHERLARENGGRK